MLHDYAPTPLSPSNPYMIAAMDELSSHERLTLSLLICLSMAAVMLLVGEARSSVASLRVKSGRHPMLGILPVDGLTQAVAEYKAEPTQAGRVLIVLNLAGLAKPFVYIGTVGLLICAYLMHFFIEEPQLGVNGIVEEEGLQ